MHLMPLNSGIVYLFIYFFKTATTAQSCFLSLVVRRRQDSPESEPFLLVNAVSSEPELLSSCCNVDLLLSSSLNPGRVWGRNGLFACIA